MNEYVSLIGVLFRLRVGARYCLLDFAQRRASRCDEFLSRRHLVGSEIEFLWIRFDYRHCFVEILQIPFNTSYAFQHSEQQNVEKQRQNKKKPCLINKVKELKTIILTSL